MALRFKCTNCGKDMVVSFLTRGETAKCRHCGAEIVVPDNAVETDEKSTISEPVARSPEEEISILQNTSDQRPATKETIGYYIGCVIFSMLFPIMVVWYGPKYLFNGEYIKGIVIILIVAVELIFLNSIYDLF